MYTHSESEVYSSGKERDHLQMLRFHVHTIKIYIRAHSLHTMPWLRVYVYIVSRTW